MADDREYNGGKFPNREDSGLGLSEFIDSAGVNSPETAPLGTEPASAGAPRRQSERSGSLLAIGGGLAVGVALGLLSRRR